MSPILLVLLFYQQSRSQESGKNNQTRRTKKEILLRLYSQKTNRNVIVYAYLREPKYAVILDIIMGHTSFNLEHCDKENRTLRYQVYFTVIELLYNVRLGLVGTKNHVQYVVFAR